MVDLLELQDISDRLRDAARVRNEKVTAARLDSFCVYGLSNQHIDAIAAQQPYSLMQQDALANYRAAVVDKQLQPCTLRIGPTGCTMTPESSLYDDFLKSRLQQTQQALCAAFGIAYEKAA